MSVPDLIPIRRALISVSDKAGLAPHAGALAKFGVILVSTGGTAETMEGFGIEVTQVSDLTGFPEMMDGRVKTLHPIIHGGLLARRDAPSHQEAMAEHNVPEFDLLYVNLYPFEEAVARGAAIEECLETIDVGGPAMIRAAAKNHDFVAVATDAEDMTEILGEMRMHRGAVTHALRRRLAAKAFARTGAYDAAISNWLFAQMPDVTPTWRAFGGALREPLRYGENPHQRAGLYLDGAPRPGAASARQVQGKELSYNNLNDTDAAYELVAEFDAGAHAAVAIVKHANPCGVALGDSVSEAYARALACDSTSAFGGVVAVNRTLDRAAAEAITGTFTEVVIAPDADEEALAVFATKKNLRLLLAGALPDPGAPGLSVKSVAGALLVQSRDSGRVSAADLRIVTQRAPTEAELGDLLFAFRVAKHVKSNAIVYAKGLATAGVGAGQMSRVDSARIARRKAEDAAHAARWADPQTVGSVCASDAFFPFADGLLQAVQAGATAVIQPGGSIRDAEVIKAADEAGLAMVFTGLRHFRH